jgi:serine/threonine protein kinase
VAAEDTVGRKLAARYTLETEIASGGMGTVWRARDEVLGRPVAVKVLHDRLARDPELLERFRMEAVAAARLSHPAVVRVFDTGVDSGTCFIVMELCQGDTLQRLLQDEGPLTPGEAGDVAASVLQGLAHAHREGVVHRDIKPSNILVDRNGMVKVTDFGIAKAAFAEEDLTATGNLLGTARYLAPEQVQGGRPDGRTDLYAMGVVLYEMLTGRVPFEGPTHIATATKRLTEEPVPPRSLRPGIPRPMDAVVLKAMARDPDDRFESAEEMGSALDRAAPSPTVPMARPEAGPSERRPLFRSWVVVPVVLLVLAALVAGGFVLMDQLRGGGDQPGEEPSRPPAHPIVSVSDLDPESSDGQENPEDAPLAADGDRDTGWITEGYAQIDLGGLKSGVGLIFDLGNPQEVAEIRIKTNLPGWEFEIQSSDDANSLGQELTDENGATSFETEGQVATVTLEDPVVNQYFVVWITLLTEDQDGRWRAEIAEVDFFPPSE